MNNAEGQRDEAEFRRPVEAPSAAERLSEALAAILSDARRDAARYNAETIVPEGGE